MARTAAMILAAGRGTRAGGDLPKQWQPLAGREVLAWSVEAFRAAPGIDDIVLVLHPQEMKRSAAYPDAVAVAGGDSRAASVRAGLAALDPARVRHVLIHDAARPLVSQRIIADVIDALGSFDGAAPALELADALWRGAEGQVIGIADRARLFRAQTPQGFALLAIRAAHAAFDGAPSDDVEVAHAAGIEVAMVPGEERNLKLTRSADFARAEAILGAGMDVRIGTGFDVHRFGPGDEVTLCGVEIPHSHGLEGHSDADVALHAITDALYGALAMGDIGRHFPPGDPQWKNAESEIFLRHALDAVADRGFTVSNIDLTLICEAPKIGPHATAMTAMMAEFTRLPPDRISIKATTTERLGFTGREEGIAAMASVLLTRGVG